MFNIQRKTKFAVRLAAAAVLSLGFAATGTPSALADYEVASSTLTQGPVQISHPYPYATGRLELAYPELARQFGPDSRRWPDRAFRNIDCSLPSNGCPSTQSGGQ